MANIASQKKRIARTEREREENLRFASAVKTHMKQLETAVASGDDAAADTEHKRSSRAWTRPSRRARCTEHRRSQEGPRRPPPVGRGEARRGQGRARREAEAGRARGRGPEAEAPEADAEAAEPAAEEPAEVAPALGRGGDRAAQRERQCYVLGVVGASARPHLQVGQRPDRALEVGR